MWLIQQLCKLYRESLFVPKLYAACSDAYDASNDDGSVIQFSAPVLVVDAAASAGSHLSLAAKAGSL